MRVVVGMDLVSVERMRESVETFGDRFLQRVFTREEIAHCETFSGDAVFERMASRFAAKEAAIKLLRPEGRFFDPRLIEVTRAEGGATDIRLHGEALSLAERQQIESLSLSMSHEGHMAAAIVVGVVNQDDRSHS